MRSAWVSVGEQMATASTSLAARIASTSATLRARGLRPGCGGGRVGVGDERNLAVGARGDVAAVDLADPPRADDAEFSCVPPSGAAPIRA